jgi:hypothetical protein
MSEELADGTRIISHYVIDRARKRISSRDPVSGKETVEYALLLEPRAYAGRKDTRGRNNGGVPIERHAEIRFSRDDGAFWELSTSKLLWPGRTTSPIRSFAEGTCVQESPDQRQRLRF